MTIPKHEEIRLPALRLLEQSDVIPIRAFEMPLAKVFKLTEEEMAQEYKTGNARIFYDRITWALSYMNMAGLVERPKRGLYQISGLGREKLNSPDTINEYIAIQLQNRKHEQRATADPVEETLTPKEELLQSSEEIKSALYEEILSVILSKSPRAFEQLVVDLLQKMGYGGEVKAAAEVTQYSNDKGIDGIIKEDVLGLGRIHIQAKRYARENSVGSREVQEFIGALAVAQSSKGVFITTSTYTKSAREAVANLSGSTKLVLIDGIQLAQYFYEYNLGVQTVETIELKKLDGDFWDALTDE